MKKRFLSILLSLCMVLALLPVTAFAEDNEEPTETPVCICEAACAAEAMNADCPVCGAEGATIENCGKYEVPVEETEPEQTAVEKVQAMLDALPTVEELENAEEATVNAAYEAAQAAYDALDVLSPEEQEQITGVEKLVALMDWFNGQVSPLADPTTYQVTTVAGAVTGYDSFSDALAAAQENNGSTLKCFADVNDTDIAINNGNFTIDANGKTFTSAIVVGSGATVTIDGNGIFNRLPIKSIIYVNGTLNIKSGTFYQTYSDGQVVGLVEAGHGGTINIFGGDFNQVRATVNGIITGGSFRLMSVAGGVRISGGKYKQLSVNMGNTNGVSVYLADGYGIKYKGSWADAFATSIGSQSDADYYVEVAESPIQDFDLQLTETEDGNLTVEVKNQVISDDYLETYPNAPAELRYRYKVDDGGWTGLTDSATYTFAPGSVGKHTISVITRLAFNNCEKSLDYYVIGYQSEDGAGTVASGVKFDGVDYILSEDTFTRDGFVQIGWQDEQGNVYDLGETYTADAGATMSPVWEEKITVEVPFTTTVDLGDNTEPGEKTFALELVSSKAGGDWEPNVTIEGSVTTDGAGNYSGKLKFTGLYDEIRRLLCESALVRQVNDGAENWTYDDTVYALVMMDDVNYASDMIYEPDVPTFHIDIYPTTEVEPGYYEFEWYGETLEEMSFKNTYTLHTHDYAQKFDADGHWDECPCGDKQNSETHKFGDWMETQAPTHTAKGEKERVCSVCNYVETAEVDEIAHAYNLNHDADGHWEECACGDKQNSETHKYGEWKVTKAATTSAKGEKEHVCSVCQYTETAEIPMLEKNEPTKTDSPQTGDNSNMALWFALILLSGGALAGTAVYGKKRKHSAK